MQPVLLENAYSLNTPCNTEVQISPPGPSLYSNGQTTPPTIEPARLYADKEMPTGMALPYKFPYSYFDPRFSSEILSYKEQCKAILADASEEVKCFREAAEIHREARKYIQHLIRPGVSLLSACEEIESRVRLLCGRKNGETDSTARGYRCGMAFPLAACKKNAIAHYAPRLSKEKNDIVTKSDVIKIDFGVHCMGRIIDSAFTMTWDSIYDPLVEATRDATAAAVNHAGIDTPIYELSSIIEEIITSYEITLPSKNKSKGYIKRHLRPVYELAGHRLGLYKIHDGDKIIPNATSSFSENELGRMLEGETYACETFASTGRGQMEESPPISCYMVSPDMKPWNIMNKVSARIFKYLKTNFSTLAFSPAWLKNIPVNVCERALLPIALNNLTRIGAINAYPMIVETSNGLTSQSEHTFMLKPTGKEIFSKGDDY